eukprot:4248631-Amphidinium_carterae.1
MDIAGRPVVWTKRLALVVRRDGGKCNYGVRIPCAWQSGVAQALGRDARQRYRLHGCSHTWIQMSAGVEGFCPAPETYVVCCERLRKADFEGGGFHRKGAEGCCQGGGAAHFGQSFKGGPEG